MHYIFEYYIIFTGQKISKMSPVQKNFHADDTSDGNARPGLSVTAAARDVFSDGVPSGNEPSPNAASCVFPEGIVSTDDISCDSVFSDVSRDGFCLGRLSDGQAVSGGASPFVCKGFSVLLFTHGMAEVRINGKIHTAGAGTVVTAISDEIVELENVSAECVCHMVSAPSEAVIDFPSPADSDILTMAMISPVFTMPDRKMNLIMEYYRLMELSGTDSDNVFRREILKSLFYSMMLEVCDAYRLYGTVVGKSAILRHEQLGDELFRLMSRHCRTHRSVSFYAEKLNITPKYLSREIKRITGRTVQEWINRLTVMEMKKQLSIPGKTVMQISEEMEFSSPSAFVQFFKLHTGTTPLKFRKSAR